MEHYNVVEVPQMQPTGASDAGKIDLVEIFYLFWSHVIQIVACAILGAILAFIGTKFFVTPLYHSEAKIYMVSVSNGSGINIADLQLGSQLTSDYRQMMLSRPLLEDVIRNLDLNIGYGALRGMISITNPSDTRILNIMVTSSDPNLSCDIANELVNQAMVYLPRIMECDKPNIIESAVVPGGPFSPNYSKNTSMGFVMGIAACCGVLLLRFLLNDSFVTSEDLVRHFGVQPLAAIPEGDLGVFNRKNNKKSSKKYSDFKRQKEKT